MQNITAKLQLQQQHRRNETATWPHPHPHATGLHLGAVEQEVGPTRRVVAIVALVCGNCHTLYVTLGTRLIAPEMGNTFWPSTVPAKYS